MATTSAKDQLEVVDPRWLLKALGITIAAAAVLSYLALCLLIYQGSWQFFLHPSAKVDTTPQVPFQAFRFDAATTGAPRLSGWWIPAESPAGRTILFLHDGSGSLSASAPKLDLLHTAGVNILAFDYRGFGQSDGPHPTESRMAEDTAAAFNYLIETRHIPASQIIPYGESLGAVLAANLADSHHDISAVVLDNPDADIYLRATTGGKSSLLPMKLLTQEHFDIAAPLSTLKIPKLLLAGGLDASARTRISANQKLFRSVPDPKMSVTLDADSRNLLQTPELTQAYVHAIRRFLDEYAR